ncbi:hypothetical protein ARZXY2_3912 [Arthrobacter sp. ZXY-2]|nr:hypothetical protein ARZXY2_3912 [Arthrobacter sp. ZXY-2]
MLRGRRDVRSDCRRQRCVCPPARSARDRVGHEVHSNDSCPGVMTGTWPQDGLETTAVAFDAWSGPMRPKNLPSLRDYGARIGQLFC